MSSKGFSAFIFMLAFCVHSASAQKKSQAPVKPAPAAAKPAPAPARPVTCIGCEVEDPLAIEVNQQARFKLPQPPPVPQFGHAWAVTNTCFQKFINQAEDMGYVGKKIHGLLLSAKYKPTFLDNDGLRMVCPAYHNLIDDDERAKAWVALLMLLSYRESGCNENAYHPESLVPGWGLFAAELNPALRKPRPGCGGSSQEDIKNWNLQVTCAIGTMDLQLKGYKSVQWSGSYWVFARNAKSYFETNMVLAYPKCFNLVRRERPAS